MKTCYKVTAAIVVVMIAAASLMVVLRPNQQGVATPAPTPLERDAVAPVTTNVTTVGVVITTNVHRRLRKIATRAADMTEEQKAQLAKKFQDRFKPALAKWCHAYAGRIPFNQDDVTLSEFHSILGYNLYTFMVNGDTLTFVDLPDSARVAYMSHGKTLQTLNTVPMGGNAPVLSIPITRDAIISMVKEDTGLTFHPDQVEISPTGAASSLSGGAFVHVGRQMMNGGEVFNGKNITMVFGQGGSLVQYEGPVL